MIKSIPGVLVTIIIANLAAVAAFFVWLGVSGRLSSERLDEVREIFKTTVAHDLAAEAEAEAEQARIERELLESGNPGQPPLDTDAIMHLWDRRDAEANERYQREAASLRYIREDIEQRRAALQAEIERFEQRVARFEDERDRVATLQSSEQFQQTVKLYSLTDAETAKNMMMTLLDAGETEQVIAYLDALKAEVSQPILAAFAEENPKLAADLLERLRTMGVQPEAPDAQP